MILVIGLLALSSCKPFASNSQTNMSSYTIVTKNNMTVDGARAVEAKAVNQLLISRCVNSLVFLFTLATMSFSILSPGVLNLIDWHYLGGGPEFQKIHVATYILVTTFLCLWLMDPRFRGNVTELFFTNWDLVSFVLAVGAVAIYAVLVKHVSVSPFVDTFLAALLVTIGWICLPTQNLRRLRYLLDLYFIINISILFIEYATRSWLIALPYPGPFRAIGFFENPLSAATLLGVYAIANLASMPVRFTRQCLVRLTLGFTSLLAISTTGGRSSLVVSGLLLLAFVTISGVRQIASGRVNRAAVVFSLVALPFVAVCIVALLQFGFFDTIVSRFEFDNGSASARQVALDLASNMPSDYVWLGLPETDINALAERQSELNLIAIEISWVNFLLTCGWVLTLPLFTTFLLFLLRFVPRYCGARAILPSAFLLIITAASNGIWAKTTVLTTSLAIILAFFRQPPAEASSPLTQAHYKA